MPAIKQSLDPALRKRIEELEGRGIFDASGAQLAEYRKLADQAEGPYNYQRRQNTLRPQMGDFEVATGSGCRQASLRKMAHDQVVFSFSSAYSDSSTMRSSSCSAEIPVKFLSTSSLT